MVPVRDLYCETKNELVQSLKSYQLTPISIDQWFTKCALRIPRDVRPLTQGIRGYISVLATLKFTYFV